jgi:hypothetical protein
MLSCEEERTMESHLAGKPTPETATADAFPGGSQPFWTRSRTQLIASGAAAALLMLGALVLFQSSSSPVQTNVSASTAPLPEAEAPPPTALDSTTSGFASPFASYIAENGWTHYESATEGFSLELPPGWGPFSTKEYGPELRFSASESPPFASFGASLFVMKHPTNGYSDPQAYFEIWRDYLATTAHLVGDVGMTTTELRDGQAFILTTVYDFKRGEHAETTYGLLDGNTSYRLVFAVSGQYLDDYRNIFNDIAMTFDLEK